MELTRRDALAALAAAGVAGGLGADALADRRERDRETLPAHDLETLVAVAEVAYPSEATNIESFVRDYAAGRVAADDGFRTGVGEAVEALDDATTDWYGGPFTELDAGHRSEALREVGAVAANPNPDGVRGERIRFSLVNEVLFAFYATPTGAGLAGLENPPGYPGGDTSYQRGPNE